MNATDTIIIDFRRYRASLTDFVNNEVVRFSATNPDAEVAIIGVLGDVYRGAFDLYLATLEASETFVNGCSSMPDWELFVGEDEHGLFCINCENFGDPGWFAHFQLTDYPFLQDTNGRCVKFIDLQGNTFSKSPTDGDSAYFPQLFNYMTRECQQCTVPASLRRSSVLRLGVQIYEAGLAEFWTVEPMPPSNRS